MRSSSLVVIVTFTIIIELSRGRNNKKGSNIANKCDTLCVCPSACLSFSHSHVCVCLWVGGYNKSSMMCRFVLGLIFPALPRNSVPYYSSVGTGTPTRTPVKHQQHSVGVYQNNSKYSVATLYIFTHPRPSSFVTIHQRPTHKTKQPSMDHLLWQPSVGL